MTYNCQRLNMAPLQDQTMSGTAVKFVTLTKQLLSITQRKICDKKLLNSHLDDVNALDYKIPVTFDSNATMLLANQLCSVVQPSESLLVKKVSMFLVNLVRCGERFQGRTFVACRRWALECLEFAEPSTWDAILLALQNLLRSGQFDVVNQDLRNLLGVGGVLLKFIPTTNEWTETHFLAMSCIEAILINKENNTGKVTLEFLMIMKNIAVDVVSAKSYENDNKLLYNKIVGCGLRILRSIVDDKSFDMKNADIIGEILGIVQAFIFHGVKSYSAIIPQCLRPAAMNIPESVYVMPRGRNLRNHKIKCRRQAPKRQEKETPEISNGKFPRNKTYNKYTSDSDTSDTDATNPARMESKVRLEALQLFHSIVQNTSSRDIFGYWPQIVASGSRADARVLSRCILREPVSKVRQVALTTITELLVGAKSFLMHAEDVDRSSFVTFFGTVSAMLRELHSSLSLLLSTERNIAVLTHALKSAAALAQGTPYSRLQPGLATKLIRNCRVQIFHKDPTIRVAALSVFEALAVTDPITPEILNILAKQSKSDTDSEISQFNSSTMSDNLTENENEINFEDIEDDDDASSDYNQDEKLHTEGISSLLHVCLKNVSNESVSAPVRLESLKLIGALAFHAYSIIFPHLDIVSNALVTAASESETQIALHAGRVVETIAGCLSHSAGHNSINGQLFWNIVFDPIARLAQHSETTLREVSCDCLGNIGSDMLAILPRERSIIVITTLFGAAQDEESAVRAAALRALGMLVEMPTLEDDVGFLMDLADVVCRSLEDQNPGVRIKAAWTLANLCDRLVKQEHGDDVEPIPLNTALPRLYQASVKAAMDHDKVKCNAVRAVGSTLYLCPERGILKDTAQGLKVLINCAVTGNDMKVRWNSCRALGFVLSHNPDDVLPPMWRDEVFPALCGLVCHSPNFKVRTNAAWALSVCESYGKHILSLWKSVVLALENSQHVPSYVEYSHRDALVEQLCITLSHLAIHTPVTELLPLWQEIRDHIEDTSIHMKHFQERVLPEKAGDTIKAKEQMEKYAQTASTSQERHVASCMIKLFQRSDRYDNLDMTSMLS